MSIRNWALNLTLSALSLAISISIAWWYLSSTQHGYGIRRRLLLDDLSIGIFESDAVLGWRNKANTKGHHRDPLGEFDVTYSIDEFNRRATPASYRLPKIILLGCSFTFGHGVSDEESFSWRLQEAFPNYKVINAAAMGWGTSQSYLVLRQLLDEFSDTKVVLYNFIEDHFRRNYVRRDWLALLHRCCDRRNPFFELFGNQLVFRGLASIKDKNLPVLPGGEMREKELKITNALLDEMKRISEEHGAVFLASFLPDRSQTSYDDVIREKVGASNFIDLRETIVHEDSNYFRDLHPRPVLHELVADRLKNFLTERLTSPSS